MPGRHAESQDCVVARVRELFPRAKGPLAVHRLDMETSGLMVLALRRDAHRHLSRQFEQRNVKKTYIALLQGRVEADSGHIELPFRVDWPNRPKQIHDPVHGKMGITDFSRKYKVDEMAKGDVVLSATGVTSGSMLSGISHQNGVIWTETLLMRSSTGTVRWIKACHTNKDKFHLND